MPVFLRAVEEVGGCGGYGIRSLLCYPGFEWDEAVLQR